MVLRNSAAILAKNLDIIRSNLKKLETFMSHNEEWFEWIKPKAGAICFLKFKGPRTSVELGDDLATVGISVKPAYCFTSDPIDDGNDYFRVGYGEAKMPDALDALARFVEARAAEWRVALGSRPSPRKRPKVAA